MTARRQTVLWILAALGAGALLFGVMEREHRQARLRWSNFLVGDPQIGRYVFQGKGCSRCHAVNGEGGRVAPDLGMPRPSPSTLDELVVAMWNHAPEMWKRMATPEVPYPRFEYEEMTHLFAYLYTARYVDEPGNAARGREIFADKGCALCHAIFGSGGTVGPDLARVSGVDTPIAWAQAMWRHAPEMEKEMQKLTLGWPKFQNTEMNDLLAYLRENNAEPHHESEFLPADPERGWKIFQEKSCIRCHSVRGEGGKVGPELGPRRDFPVMIVQFSGAMWNHSPEMWRAMQARKIPRPSLTGKEMADLMAFLLSVRYFEPGGSPNVGAMLFARRGCSRCHGSLAEGTNQGPALRNRGRVYTSVTLATELWRHGREMYQSTQRLRLTWPVLADGDVGDLLVFLNRPAWVATDASRRDD